MRRRERVAFAQRLRYDARMKIRILLQRLAVRAFGAILVRERDLIRLSDTLAVARARLDAALRKSA